MDGYRSGDHRQRTYSGARRSSAAISARTALGLRRLFLALTSGKTVSALRYALGAASFIFMLGVIAAMESGIVSLGAGLFICLCIGACYLLAGHGWREEEDDE